MRTFTKEELKEILELHKKWLNDEDDGVRADLSSANLRSADLSYANLRGADLSSADLSSADLRYANLRSADLRGADLSGADLSYANLRGADLSYANLRGAVGEMLYVRSMQLEKYRISYTDKILNIGCRSHKIEEWEIFTDKEISEKDSDALDWWKKWKEILFTIIKMAPAEKQKD